MSTSHVTTVEGLSAVRAAIKSLLSAITLNGQAVQVYDYDPGVPDTTPCIYMSVPELVTPDIDQDQNAPMGNFNVDFTWPCTIVLNTQDLKFSQDSLFLLMGSVADAVEANQTLNLMCEDMRVVSMQPTFAANQSNQWLECECTLHGYFFVDQG